MREDNVERRKNLCHGTSDGLDDFTLEWHRWIVDEVHAILKILATNQMKTSINGRVYYN